MLTQDNRRDMLNGGSTEQVGGGRAASLISESAINGNLKTIHMEPRVNHVTSMIWPSFLLFFLDSLLIKTDRAKDLNMNENKSDEELLDSQEDERLSDLNDKNSVDLQLQDGAGSPRGSNNNQTPASSQEISLLTSAIQLLTKSLPGPLHSSLVEEKRPEKGKGKRPACSAADAAPAKKSRANDDKESEAQNSTSASADSNDRQALQQQR